LLRESEDASLTLVRSCIPLLATDAAPRRVQDHAAATTVPQRSPADGRIDWSWDAARIDRFIRAQTKPYPGAFTDIGGKRVRIWAADIEELAAVAQASGDAAA
jgi:methionyl-tRNA formyltransferase